MQKIVHKYTNKTFHKKINIFIMYSPLTHEAQKIYDIEIRKKLHK